MSRLHSQKRRLRAQQREDGLIEPDSDTVDRDAFQEVGSSHEGVRKALELVERHGAADEALPNPETSPKPHMAEFLATLSPAELEELRETIARKRAESTPEQPAEDKQPTPPAQNPPA